MLVYILRHGVDHVVLHQDVTEILSNVIRQRRAVDVFAGLPADLHEGWQGWIRLYWRLNALPDLRLIPAQIHAIGAHNAAQGLKCRRFMLHRVCRQPEIVVIIQIIHRWL